MKNCVLAITMIIISLPVLAQKLPSGTYQFKYCDLEYNKCISTCTVIIKDDHIKVYATKKLAKNITSIKAGEIIDRGALVKQKNGEWIIREKKKRAAAGQTEDEIPSFIDFKKKEYWRF